MNLLFTIQKWGLKPGFWIKWEGTSISAISLSPKCRKKRNPPAPIFFSVRELRITLIWPGYAVENFLSTQVLYETFPIFIHKKPKEILIHWSQMTQFLVLNFLFITDPFTFHANLVLVLWFSYQSFPRPCVSNCTRGNVCSCLFMSSVSSGYSQSVDVKLSESENHPFVDWGSSTLTQQNSNPK